ncbi:hypothetical protein [Rhizobium sp. S96]|uniref:hypothetical protein n=1 Tax=Rhizobium sp. S96 TaxID=3055140 RepID=UPI0025AB2BEF|nr:hypothetical protein [Rhizobium sp. S96]MDM9619085.1 hypothetical protein [Rhizobium sp. S96]
MVTKKAKTVETIDPNAPTGSVAPATEFDPSGAPIQAVADVDPSHPAVDADPRANTTEEQNRIDFNDPSLSGSEAAAKALGYKPENGEDK